MTWTAGSCSHTGPLRPLLPGWPSLFQPLAHTFFTGACRGADGRCGKELGSSQGQRAWAYLLRVVGNNSKGPQMRRALTCPSAASPTGLRVDAGRQALLQDSPAAWMPLCQLPGQPWSRPNRCSTNQGCSFPTVQPPEESMWHPSPRPWCPDSPAPRTPLSSHAHLCNSPPSHMCSRPYHTRHLATRIPVLHTLPVPIITRTHVPNHSPHTCSHGQHADMARALAHTDSVNTSLAPTWCLATPLLCEEYEHPQLSMVSGATCSP